MDNNSKNSGTITMTPENDVEKLQYDDSVLKKIVNTAAQEVDGVLSLGSSIMESLTSVFKGGDSGSTQGVSVAQHDGRVDVDLKLVVEYGKNIPGIVAEVEARIREGLMNMAGMGVDKLTVYVVDTMTRADYEAKKNKDKDKENNQE